LRIIAARLVIVNSKKKKFEDLLQVLVKRHEILLKTPLLLNVYLKRNHKSYIIEDQQLEGQSSTQPEPHMAYLSTSISTLHFLCGELSTAYKSYGWTKISATTKKEKSTFEKVLSTIMDMYLVYCRLILTKLRYIPWTSKYLQ
jgi:hypothetical protein